MKYEGHEDFEVINNKKEYLISDLGSGSIIKVLKVNNDVDEHYKDIEEKLFLVTEKNNNGIFMLMIESGRLWYNEALMKEDIDYVLIKQR